MWSNFLFFIGFIYHDRSALAHYFARVFLQNRRGIAISHALACAKSYDRKKPARFVLQNYTRSYEMHRGYGTRSRNERARTRQIKNRASSRVIRSGLKLQHPTRSSYPRRDKGKKGSVSPLCIFIAPAPPAIYDSHAMRRRHGRIRATCNNAIVRTTGNNWTIYEPRGLALRMYDYRGKRCVAHTLWTGLWRTSWPRYHPALSACNYSRGRCISIPRLIVKIALGIQQKDNIGEAPALILPRRPRRAVLASRRLR